MKVRGSGLGSSGAVLCRPGWVKFVGAETELWPRLPGVSTAVYDHDAATLVLDLPELTFIDSSGLRQLVAALQRQGELGGNVVLHAPSDQILKILEMVGMTSLFIIT